MQRTLEKSSYAAAAALAVGAAFLLTKALWPLEQHPAALFLGAVLVSAWGGGWGPGLLATILSTLILELFFTSQGSSLNIGLPESARLGVFLLVSFGVVSLNGGRKQTERVLRQRDRRKDEFMAVLAHELRNPLAALFNALAALRRGRADPQAIEAAASLAERQARHMARLIEDLLDVERINAGKLPLHLRSIDPASVATEAVETVRPLMEERGHRLEVALPRQPASLKADPTRLRQVLINLLTNASKYTPAGGSIRLTVEPDGGHVVFRVRDTGIGIPPELLPHVFDLFAQAEDGSQGGLGIGLNLVQGLVRLHGGSITASSGGLGSGSEFVARFPTAETASNWPPQPSRSVD